MMFTKEDVPGLLARMGRYTKRRDTLAMRIEGLFEVQTREGFLVCQDGYLAVDSHGWPYPIAKDEFEAIYRATQAWQEDPVQ